MLTSWAWGSYRVTEEEKAVPAFIPPYSRWRTQLYSHCSVHCHWVTSCQRSARVSEKSRSRQFLASLEKSRSRQPWNCGLDRVSISTIDKSWVSSKSRSRQFWKFESRASLDLTDAIMFWSLSHFTDHDPCWQGSLTPPPHLFLTDILTCWRKDRGQWSGSNFKTLWHLSDDPYLTVQILFRDLHETQIFKIVETEISRD